MGYTISLQLLPGNLLCLIERETNHFRQSFDDSPLGLSQVRRGFDQEEKNLGITLETEEMRILR